MAKSNALKCREYRQNKKAKGRELKLPLPPGTDKCLAELMAWHGHDDEREAISTLIHQLHAMGPEGSKGALTVLRHEYTVSDEMAQRLVVEGSRVKAEPEHDWR